MKYLLINNLYPPFARGGAETVVRIIAEKLCDEGHEVHILSTKPHGSPDSQDPGNRIKRHYVRGLYYDLSRLPLPFRLVWHFIDMFDVRTGLAVRSLVRSLELDAVFTHNLKGIGFFVPLAIRLGKCKHIHTLHDIQLLHPSGLMYYGREKALDTFPAKTYQLLCRALFGSPDCVISASSWLMDEHERRGFFRGSKKLVQPNPIPDAQSPISGIVKPKVDAPGKKGKFEALYVGQMEDHKGVGLLVEAFMAIPQTDASLTMIGDGSALEELKNKIAMNGNIRLAGRAGRDEVAEAMQKSDCLVVPSTCYENSPTVIYEAFAAGLPVIAADIGGISEIVLPAGSILFKPADKGSLAEKILWAVDHREELADIGEKGRESIDNFQIGKYIKKLASLCQSSV